MGVSMNILNILSDGKAEQAMLNYKPETKESIIPRNRMLHMYGVAELMYQYYDDFNCKYLSKEECYVLGLLHDIGYMKGYENHEYYGCEILSDILQFGHDSTMSKCISAHGLAPQKYKELYNLLSDDEIMDELILLWWADMTIESTGEHAGEIVGFQQRLEGIKNRFGEDSIYYKDCAETVDWLCNHIAQKLLTV